ncbi:hypothetical protein BgiBS90_023832 [Biomphalaria glabrata]|nr:hypothetical protein BgiBS90_023832 [Biomphalaria glabrata]
MCTSAIIIDIGIVAIDECQSIQTKSELARERHLQLELEETYLLDVRLFAEDDRGSPNFVRNLAACEPEDSMAAENSADDFMENTLPASCASHRSTST